MTRPAYAFVQDFEPAPAQELCVDRHYLLCASKGAVRLEDDTRAWTLPPARAALIEADRPITVTILRSLRTASVLFDPAFTPAPPGPLTVIELSPLARELINACSRWGDEPAPLPPLGTTLFQALAGVVWDLTAEPSPTAMPTGRTPELRRALVLTGEQLSGEPTLEAIAASVGLASRTLARRFESELGMTWRAALRRLRVLRAIELLADDTVGVAHAASNVGYGSLSAFNAAFRDVTGRTPTEYRSTFQPRPTKGADDTTT